MAIRTTIAVLAVSVALVAASAAAASPLGPYKVNATRVTTGGLSAGAFFAVQYHVAFSTYMKGASVFAGGPYYCAQNSEITALTSCMNPNMVYKPPSASSLASFTNLAYLGGHIDNPANLASAKVFVYSGLLDSVVHRSVVEDAVSYYNLFVNASSGGVVTTEYDILSEHMYPTLDYGEACTNLGEPFIGKCNYDGAGAALKVLYGNDLAPRGTPVASNLMTFEQTAFVSDPASLSLNTIGFIYVPTACQKGATCGLHVSFHGCKQSTSNIQNQYAADTGLNNWAETNNIIVLYPQVVPSYVSPANPDGCWDWWGYTNANYAYQTGPQMAFVHKIVQAIMGTSAQ